MSAETGKIKTSMGFQGGVAGKESGEGGLGELGHWGRSGGGRGE